MSKRQELIKSAMYKYGLSEAAATEYVNKELQDVKSILEKAEEHKALLKQRVN